MKVLITGPSGSGKSFLAEYFSSQGYNAKDADLIENLGDWYNFNKERVAPTKNATKEFMDNHEFLWNKEVLDNVLAGDGDLFLFGSSGNVFDFTDKFDYCFYLDIPIEEMNHRLAHPQRSNPDNMGSTAEQRELIDDYVINHFRPEAELAGLIFLDARNKRPVLMNEILKLTGTMKK